MIYEGKISTQSMELILANYDQDNKYRGRFEKLKEKLVKIGENLDKRIKQIHKNEEMYLGDKVIDLDRNAKIATRLEIEELVKARGFTAEINATVEELKEQEPQNDLQKLKQTLLEIELRGILMNSDNFPMAFMGEIMEGNPLMIQAIKNAPVHLPIDGGVLADAEKKMIEVLKPLVYKRYETLKQAQRDLEGMANSIMPVDSKPDEIAELTKGDQA